MINFFKKLFSKIPDFQESKPLKVSSIRDVKDLNEEEKTLLKAEYDLLMEKISERDSASRKSYRERVEKANSQCPKCESKDVIEKIRRGKGEISGSGRGSVSGIGVLGTGVLSGISSSSLKGNFDTLPVNFCKSCGNEWKREEFSWSKGSVSLYDVCENLISLVRLHSRAVHVEFDPNDLSEKYSSLEEKREDYLKKVEEGVFMWSSKRDFSEFSLELIAYVMKEYSKSYRCSDSEYEKWLNTDLSLIEKITTKRISNGSEKA